MPVVMDPPEEQLRRSRIIQAVTAQWTAEQIAAGVDGPVPDDRPDGSDYNQHVPAMESSGAALDDLASRIEAALR